METTENDVLLGKWSERLKSLRNRIAWLKMDLGVMLEKVKKFEMHPLLIIQYETAFTAFQSAIILMETELIRIETYILACHFAPDPDESYLSWRFEKVEKEVAEIESKQILELKKEADETEEEYLKLLLASLNNPTQVM